MDRNPARDAEADATARYVLRTRRVNNHDGQQNPVVISTAGMKSSATPSTCPAAIVPEAIAAASATSPAPFIAQANRRGAPVGGMGAVPRRRRTPRLYGRSNG